MKKTILSITAIFLTALIIFGQNQKVPIKSVPTKTVQSQTTAQNINKIPVNEWDAMTKALDDGEWNKASLLVSASLKKLTTENENKQLARLRYFYLYSLAGKVVQKQTIYEELEKIADSFIGQEFVMPSRTIEDNCDKWVNSICPVTDNEKALRVTATDKFANIHSFEYVSLPDKFNFTENNKKEAFLSGKLKKVETNSRTPGIQILRLFFENGAVEIVAKAGK